MKTVIVVSTIIFRDDGKILTMRRSATDANRPGQQDIPNGEANEREEPFDAAVREISEETGLHFTTQQLRLVFGWSNVREHPEEKIIVNFVYCGFVAHYPNNQTVRMSHEHQDFAWRSIDDAIEGFKDRESKHRFLRHVRDNAIEPKFL